MCFGLLFHCFFLCFCFQALVVAFFVDAPLILSCPVNHVLEWQPRILLGIWPDWLIMYQVCSKHSRRFAGLEACFLLVTVFVSLFLFDKFRLKHLLKHANKKKTREDCCSVPVTCKTVRFFLTHCEVRVPWHRARGHVSCTPTEP